MFGTFVRIESSSNFSLLSFVAKIAASFCGWPEYALAEATASYQSPLMADYV